MSDIVQRLRNRSCQYSEHCGPSSEYFICDGCKDRTEAATEIERLRAGTCFQHYDDYHEDMGPVLWIWLCEHDCVRDVLWGYPEDVDRMEWEQPCSCFMDMSHVDWLGLMQMLSAKALADGGEA